MMHVGAIEDLGEIFAMRCTDDAMCGVGILKGDTVLIRRTTDINDGAIAAVRTRETGEAAVLRRLYSSDDRITLVPENPSYSDIVVSAIEDIEIYGTPVMMTRPIQAAKVGDNED